MNIDWTNISDIAGLTTIIPVILTALGTAWATRLFERKKYKADIESLKHSNIAAEHQIFNNKMKTFQMLTDDLQERLKVFKNEMRTMEDENFAREAEYRKRIRQAEDRIQNLEKEIVQLESKICVKDCNDRLSS